MLKMLAKIFILSFALTLPLQAEIQKVTIKWTSALCAGPCVKELYHYFSLVPGVADVQIDQPGGQAIVRWKPNVPFTYQSMDTVTRLVGLYQNEIRVRVQGQVSHNLNNFRITSLGDGTTFNLLAPVTPSRTQYVEENNEETRQLSQEMKNQLLEAQQNNQMVTIEGPLFLPERSPPMQIIIESFKVEERNPDNTGAPATPRFGVQLPR